MKLVKRDARFATGSVQINVEQQIFQLISPGAEVKDVSKIPSVCDSDRDSLPDG